MAVKKLEYKEEDGPTRNELLKALSGAFSTDIGQCPDCENDYIEDLGNGYYECDSCGYTGKIEDFRKYLEE